MSLFVQLSTEWANHPKLIRAGLAGRGLHALVLTIAKSQETDGWVDRLLLHREGADDELIDRLVELRLLDVDDAHPGEVRPHNWHRDNPSQAAIDATRAAKAEAARKGNHKRWRHPGEFEDCETCNPKPQVVAGCETGAIGSDRKPSPESESDTESEPTTPPTPRAEPGQVRLQAVAAVAEEEAGPRRTDGAYCRGIRREILAGLDGRLERIDAELAAGKSPEDIAASWTTTAPDTLLDSFRRTAGVPVGGPRLEEFHGFPDEPIASAETAKSIIRGAKP